MSIIRQFLLNLDEARPYMNRLAELNHESRTCLLKFYTPAIRQFLLKLIGMVYNTCLAFLISITHAMLSTTFCASYRINLMVRNDLYTI